MVLVSLHWSAEMDRGGQRWRSLSPRSGLASPLWQNSFTSWAWASQQESWTLCLAQAAGHLCSPGLDWLAVPTTIKWCQSSWQLWGTIAIQAVNTMTLPWDPHLSHHTALHCCLACQGSHTKTWVHLGWDSLKIQPSNHLTKREFWYCLLHTHSYFLFC